MGVLDVKFVIYIRIWFWKPDSRKVDIQELVENKPLKVDDWHRLARKKDSRNGIEEFEMQSSKDLEDRK